MHSLVRRLLPAVLGAALLLPAALPAAASSYAFGTDADFEYALIEGGTDGDRTISSSGSWEEIQRIGEKYKGPLFWFARDGRVYVVRDAALLAEARRILRPVQELGAKQGKVGALQGRLGARQGRLGREQGRLGAKQGMLGARLGSLASAAAWGGDDERASRSELRRIEEEMEELGRAQEALARRQEPLAEQQGVLGEQQAELGRRQATASKKAGMELRRLADRAIDGGKAAAIKE